jgi:cell wall-associated NlpC family hydrolase
MADECVWSNICRALVGRPFVWAGRGPEGFDCWGLVLEARRRAGLPAPADIATPEGGRVLREDLAAVPPVIEAEVASGRWRQVLAPTAGDVVALSRHLRLHHVGVWTPVGILHTLPKRGAHLERLMRLQRAGYGRIEYYRWAG